MTWCCRLKTHLQGLPVCRVSFTGETPSSCSVCFLLLFGEKINHNTTPLLSAAGILKALRPSEPSHLRQTLQGENPGEAKPFSAGRQSLFLTCRRISKMRQSWRGKCAPFLMREMMCQSKGARSVVYFVLSPRLFSLSLVCQPLL